MGHFIEDRSLAGDDVRVGAGLELGSDAAVFEGDHLRPGPVAGGDPAEDPTGDGPVFLAKRIMVRPYSGLDFLRAGDMEFAEGFYGIWFRYSSTSIFNHRAESRAWAISRRKPPPDSRTTRATTPGKKAPAGTG